MGSVARHNVTAYGCALREANNMPLPVKPKRPGSIMLRSRVTAHPNWRELSGNSEGWVLEEHISGGLVKKENLPATLRKIVDSQFAREQKPSHVKDKKQGSSGGAADGSATMTLHQKRRGRDRRGKGRSSWRDEFAATDSSGFSFESTQASGLHGAWTQGSLATRVLPDTLEKTSKSDGRLNTLENTSFSLHEQPTLLSYCSTRSHSLLVDKAHKKFGARYMGPRSQSAQGPREETMTIPRAKEPTPRGIPGAQKIGIQRGAGENGVLRPPGKTFIVACPQDLSRTQKKSTYKLMHNTQALKREKKSLPTTLSF